MATSANSQTLPVPQLPEPGPLSAIYKDSNISLRYPENWIVTKSSPTRAVIAPSGADLALQGHPNYYTHGLFVRSYKPAAQRENYSFEDSNKEIVAAIIQSNGGSQPSEYPPVSVKVSGHAGIVTRIENPDTPFGLEFMFNLSVDLGDRTETILLFTPASDAVKYNPIFTRIMASVIVSEHAVTSSPSGAGAEPRSRLAIQEIAKRASASTVLIVSANQNGTHAALGSGFVIRPGFVVTNSHVLTPGRMGLVHVRNSDEYLNVQRTVARDVKDDLVLLEVPGLLLVPLPLSVEPTVIGDTVFTMGNPEGMEGTFSEGLVSAFRTLGQKQFLQITAPISHGSSGGPVLNIYGEVIGVSTAMLESGQNLNFAVPAAAITTLLDMTR